MNLTYSADTASATLARTLTGLALALVGIAVMAAIVYLAGVVAGSVSLVPSPVLEALFALVFLGLVGHAADLAAQQ